MADIRHPDVAEPHVSLREYVDVRFESQERATTTALAAQEKAVAAALAAADRAVAKAEAASERRFESVNEFRGTLLDQARTFMPRLEYETSHKALVEKVEAVQKFLWMGLGAMVAVQLFIGFVFVFLKKTP